MRRALMGMTWIRMLRSVSNVCHPVCTKHVHEAQGWVKHGLDKARRRGRMELGYPSTCLVRDMHGEDRGEGDFFDVSSAGPRLRGVRSARGWFSAAGGLSIRILLPL